MKTEFKVKLNINTMYHFLMYHMYHGFGGIFSVIIGLGLIGYGIYAGNSVSNSWIYIFFGVIFLIYEPTTLYTRAAKQIKTNPVFKEAIQYEVSEEGIKIIQGEVFNVLPWDKIYKVMESRQCIFIYTNVRNAIILEKKQMGSSEAVIRKLIKAKVPAAKSKLKG